MTDPTISTRVKALLFEPDKPPRYVETFNTMNVIETILMGEAESLPFPGESRVAVWINAAGKDMKMPRNHFASRRLYNLLHADEWLAGPVLMMGTLGDEIVDIPPEFAQYMIDRCKIEIDNEDTP